MSDKSEEIKQEIDTVTMSPTHTSCQDCVWGTYDSQLSTTQKDCSLELLNYYKGKETEILEAYNEKGEFFIISGRKCYFKRDKEWFDKNYNKDGGHIEKVHNETQIKYMAIIDGKDDLLDIKLTISSLLNQLLQPSYLVVLRKFGSTIDIRELNQLLIDTGKKWRVSTPSTPEITAQTLVTGLVDIFAEKYPIYVYMDAGHVLLKNEMTNINNRIIYDDYKFGIIPLWLNDKICNSIVHKFYRGEFPQECIMPSME